jgi:hypothetical protein
MQVHKLGGGQRASYCGKAGISRVARPLASASCHCGAGLRRVLAHSQARVIAAKQGQLVQRAAVIAAAQQ